MGIFDFLKPNSGKEFVNERAFDKNRTLQMQMAPKTLEQLYKYDVTEEKELKLEFFFYTNTAEKAEYFATELEKLNYSVHHGISASNKKLFIITGWTNKIKMADDIVANWTERMCEIGYEFDCEFDGWGTNPNQD
ncbi:MAG TPA: ribonuclease E inhibitor RraB [Mucilaginibacter sp.]